MLISRKFTKIIFGILGMTVLISANGCADSIDDDLRIPAYAVNIRLDNQGLWNTFGVGGYGLYRYFVRETHEPANFSFNETTFTGFGGVLLIGGTNPFSGESYEPMAYDMACPVERRQDVRVRIDNSNLEAVCPVCLSRYDVIMNAGAPVAGPAVQSDRKYRLRMLRCIPSQNGGFIIAQR